jgi:hypothetical protein
MPKYFTTKTDDQLRWPEFINATDAKDVLLRLGREGGDYASDMQFLKLHLNQVEYKKLFARYRQFKHRRINDLVTFKVPRTTIERINQYAFQLGYPQSTNPCLVDILHFLSDPIEMHELQEKIRELSLRISQ